MVAGIQHSFGLSGVLGRQGLLWESCLMTMYAVCLVGWYGATATAVVQVYQLQVYQVLLSYRCTTGLTSCLLRRVCQCIEDACFAT